MTPASSQFLEFSGRGAGQEEDESLKVKRSETRFEWVVQMALYIQTWN